MELNSGFIKYQLSTFRRDILRSLSSFETVIKISSISTKWQLRVTEGGWSKLKWWMINVWFFIMCGCVNITALKHLDLSFAGQLLFLWLSMCKGNFLKTKNHILMERCKKNDTCLAVSVLGQSVLCWKSAWVRCWEKLMTLMSIFFTDEKGELQISLSSSED